MKYFSYLILISFFFLFSCNNEEKDNEIKNLKEQLAKKHNYHDSISIYHAIENKGNIKFVNKFLDSLKIKNPKLYRAFIDETTDRLWSRDDDYNDEEEFINIVPER